MKTADMETMEKLARLGLYPTKDTLPFWDALLAGSLVTCRCAACGRFRQPPSGFCPGCRHTEVVWQRSDGVGTVYSFTWARHAFTPGLRDRVPYVIALVELDDAPGVRLIANILDAGEDQVRVGARVVADHRNAAEARIDFVLRGEADD
ncbi:Zn-ribbon domain-containing OB-fold protein [Acrocarpospora catenulata]|uniref:Zn-ribbon domain-containing OB-fold protein n=1 Tax=Acrocarpospora catenulata TaxID=2836182 RepID=UPI001BDA01E5|nr:OB-fold domain-containing protein [Acrocarpospora catenulata]